MIFRSVNRSNQFSQTQQDPFGGRFQTQLTTAPQPDALPVQSQSSSPAPLEVAPTPAPVQVDLSTGFRDLEWQVYDFTNQQRIQAGLVPLTLNFTLNGVAEKHSVDMATRSYFSHQGLDGSLPWDRMRAGGYNYSRAAENIAFGYPSALEVVTAWMNSPGHRQNILDPNLREIGVGFYSGYWTQNFGTAMQIA